jgi:ribosome-binding factor A
MKPEVKKDTNRIAKVNSLIQHELGPVLHEFLDWQKGLVTITKVETSKDMKYAKIWISIFNPGPTPSQAELLAAASKSRKQKPYLAFDEKILKFLAENIYDIQGEVNKHFHTKIIPRISFHLDTTPRYAQHIEEVLKRVREEDTK